MVNPLPVLFNFLSVLILFPLNLIHVLIIFLLLLGFWLPDLLLIGLTF